MTNINNEIINLIHQNKFLEARYEIDYEISNIRKTLDINDENKKILIFYISLRRNINTWIQDSIEYEKDVIELKNLFQKSDLINHESFNKKYILRNSVDDILKIKDFLVYNRAWAGTREYRLKFAEILVQNDLAHCCQMGFNPTESDQHYTQHTFKNSNFEINSVDLEDCFFLNNTESSASADYVAQDYNETGIEVVLETLFDDVRWHLTEKALRPIACGQPFVLAATAGSLEYVRSYGFETFDGLIDETYDTVADPVKRLHCIAAEMKRISLLAPEQKVQLWAQLQAIADRNKRRFFGKEFWTQVVSEYTTNLQAGLELMEHYCNGNLFTFSQSLNTLFLNQAQLDKVCSKIK